MGGITMSRSNATVNFHEPELCFTAFCRHTWFTLASTAAGLPYEVHWSSFVGVV
jgi:hypothetical protein